MADFEATCATGTGETLFGYVDGERVKIGVDAGECGEDNVLLTFADARRLRDWLTSAIGEGPAPTDERPTMPLDTSEWEVSAGAVLSGGPTMAQTPGHPWFLVAILPNSSALWARRRERA